MNHLFSASDAEGMLQRIDALSPRTPGQWGKMNVTQMLAHCALSLETAMGKNVVPRAFILARLAGKLMRKKALGPQPFGKNLPTAKSYVFSNYTNLDFDTRKAQLKRAIIHFSEGGPLKCTQHPHPYYGHLTPEEWAVFEWKHLDHHLRQFGV